jgi:hypothetical protein
MPPTWTPKTLNEGFSTSATRRRYEVWFLRLSLADGSGAWWFRYLLMNPARGGCPGNPRGLPAQIWATWFPTGAPPQSFIQGFPLSSLQLSKKDASPFSFRLQDNVIDENSCQGSVHVDGHSIAWNLQYRSSFRVTLSSKGWIGFSRTPHSDAVFSGSITLDGQSFRGNPLGFGVQGHNCGYRHRKFWSWTHAYFQRANAPPSTLEALTYEMPFGLVFRRAVLFHGGVPHIFRNLRTIENSEGFGWEFDCSDKDGLQLHATIDGSGPSLHRLPYLKTNCVETFEVLNNSLAKARIRLESRDARVETLETTSGAVLEKAGQPIRTLGSLPDGLPPPHTPKH